MKTNWEARAHINVQNAINELKTFNAYREVNVEKLDRAQRYIDDARRDLAKKAEEMQ